MAPKYKLVYFNLMAFAEPIRLVFAYVGVPYEDVRIEFQDWRVQKANFPWDQVPTLEVDGQVIAQSQAILRYLGREFNLVGDNNFEAAKCDEMIEALYELRTEGSKVFLERDPDYKNELASVFLKEIIPRYFAKWDKILHINRGFLVGKRFSYADFCIASYLQIYNETFGRGLFENFPSLKAHQELVFNTPGIKEWVAKRPKTMW